MKDTRRLADLLEQQLRLFAAECCRRFVEDQKLGVERQRLGDLDLLLGGDAQRAHLALRRDVEAEPLQLRRGLCIHGRAVDAAAAHRQAPDIDILRHRKVGQQLQFLVDHADAGLDGGGGVGGGIGLPPPDDGAGIGLVGAMMFESRLPAPFSPSSATTSPSRTSKLASARTWTGPKLLQGR